MVDQQSMESDVAEENQTTFLQNRREKGRRSPIRIQFDQLPRIQKKQPITFIPACYENVRKEERKKEVNAGTGKRRRRYNPQRHLHKDDFVFASAVRAMQEEKRKQNQLSLTESRHRHASTPINARAHSEGQDLCDWLDQRQSVAGQDKPALARRNDNMGAGTGRDKAHILDCVFDIDGVRLRGAQFGGLNRIPQNLMIDPPPKTCFR